MDDPLKVADIDTYVERSTDCFRLCKAVGGAFDDVAKDIFALHAIIKQIDDEYKDETANGYTLILKHTKFNKLRSLGRLFDNYSDDLLRCRSLAIEYGQLDYNNRQTWDKLRYGQAQHKDNLQDIQESLIEHKSYLALFLESLRLDCQRYMRQKLDELIADVRAERRPESVFRMADMNEDSYDAQVQWERWKTELAERGTFRRMELENHKQLIMDILRERVGKGYVKETARGSRNRTPSKDISGQGSNNTTGADFRIPYIFNASTWDGSRSLDSSIFMDEAPRYQATVEDEDDAKISMADHPSIISEARPSRKGKEKQGDFQSDPTEDQDKAALYELYTHESGGGKSYWLSSGILSTGSDDGTDVCLPSDSISQVGSNLETTQQDSRSTKELSDHPIIPSFPPPNTFRPQKEEENGSSRNSQAYNDRASPRSFSIEASEDPTTKRSDSSSAIKSRPPSLETKRKSLGASFDKIRYTPVYGRKDIVYTNGSGTSNRPSVIVSLPPSSFTKRLEAGQRSPLADSRFMSAGSRFQEGGSSSPRLGLSDLRNTMQGNPVSPQHRIETIRG
ncbi:hypothetical protein EG329_005734 [Mollisiaceae sp. DMI_Dod_QoI]|nr:hypothetical protein EG329_005734 [Helotiales sp. DMI_Dod_QoI]